MGRRRRDRPSRFATWQSWLSRRAAQSPLIFGECETLSKFRQGRYGRCRQTSGATNVKSYRADDDSHFPGALNVRSPRKVLSVEWDEHGRIDVICYKPGDWEDDLKSLALPSKPMRSTGAFAPVGEFSAASNRGPRRMTDSGSNGDNVVQ
jgi:hypothetical protein